MIQNELDDARGDVMAHLVRLRKNTWGVMLLLLFPVTSSHVKGK